MVENKITDLNMSYSEATNPFFRSLGMVDDSIMPCIIKPSKREKFFEFINKSKKARKRKAIKSENAYYSDFEDSSVVLMDKKQNGVVDIVFLQIKYPTIVNSIFVQMGMMPMGWILSQISVSDHQAFFAWLDRDRNISFDEHHTVPSITDQNITEWKVNHENMLKDFLGQ